MKKANSAPYQTFGETLEKLRLKAGIKNQSDFAALVKASQQTVSRWERGLSRPRQQQLVVVARVLKVKDAAELFAAAGYGPGATRDKSGPVSTVDQPFPIDALTPDSFERFCLYFLEKNYREASVHRAGGQGHTQEGIDVEVRFPDGKRFAFQCKRAGEFGPAKVRGAVAACKRRAAKKFLLLSRVASPQARDAIAKHRGWEIWDKEDISARVRELPRDEQRQLVDVFFRGQRLALLGEDEPGPWQTPEYFFKPFMAERGAFRHSWPLVGREKETQAILDGLSDDAIRVILLVATGGGGKSRTLKQVVDKLQGSSRGTLVRFLSPTSLVTEKSLEDLGTAPKILIVDDAHDRNDLPLLFQYAARPDSKATLVLSLRPYGVDYLKAQAGSLALSGDAIREIRLPSPSLEDAIALAKQVLHDGGGPEDAAKPIAQATRDCPLATVMAAQIVAREGHHFELAKNDEAFKATLLGKFQDVIAGDIGEKSDAEPIRQLLRVLALLQPFHPDDPVIARTVEAVEHLAIPQVNRLLRLLCDGGVLFKRGGQFRLSPDLLADFIIEKACVGQGGRSTGYAEQILDKIGDAHLQRLLLNLGRLDWRLSSGDPSTSPLMDGIWAHLRLNRQDCGKAVAEVAYFQPGRALDYAADVMEDGFFPTDLPDLLKYASYSLACAPRGFALLWRLATEHETNPYAERAIKLLADLCAVEPNKPFAYNELVVDFGLSLLPKSESWNGKYTPLHILEGILRACGDICESNGRQLRINRFGVSPEFAGPLRKKVVEATVKLLTHGETKIALAAARFLKKALQYPMYGGLRREWTSEFVGTLEQVEKTIMKARLDHLVIIQMAQSVTWLAQFANDDTSPVARRILGLIPESLEARTTLALVDEFGEIFERMHDVGKCERDSFARIDALAKDLMQAFPDAPDLYAFLKTQLQHIRQYWKEDRGPTFGLYWHLLASSPPLVELVIMNALAGPEMEEQNCFVAALATKLARDRANGIVIATRCLQSTSDSLHIGVSRAYNCIDPATLLPEDIAIVRRLLASLNSMVVDNALTTVRRLGVNDQALALELLRIVAFGDSRERADSVLGLLGRPIPLESLSEALVQEFLNKLAAIPELDGHWIETFLAYASQHYADMAADLFMKRVEHSSDDKNWSFRPCNYGPFAHIGLRFREAKEYSDILRRVVSWMRSRGEDDYFFNENASRLFEAMFDLADERILGYLGDWIDTATPAELQSIGAILNKAWPEFIFQHRSLVVRLLDKAEGFGRDLLQDMRSELYSAAVSGMRSGVAGEPFPQDIKMKEAAEQALAEIPRFSPAYELFEAIRKHAEREIARARQEAELFED